MALTTWVDYNKTGFDNLVIFASQSNTGLIPLWLLGIFLMILIPSMFYNKRTSGQYDFFASATVASFMTTTFAMLLRLSSGVVSLQWLVLCAAVTTLFMIAFYVSRER